MTVTNGKTMGASDENGKRVAHSDLDAEPDAEDALSAAQRAVLDELRVEEIEREAVPDGETVPDEIDVDGEGDPLDVDEYGIPTFLQPPSEQTDAGDPPDEAPETGRTEPTTEPKREHGRFAQVKPEADRLEHRDHRVTASAREAKPDTTPFNALSERIAHAQGAVAGEMPLADATPLSQHFMLVEVLFCFLHLPLEKRFSCYPRIDGERRSFVRNCTRDGRFAGGFRFQPGEVFVGDETDNLSIVPDGVPYGRWARMLPMLLFTTARSQKDPLINLGTPHHILREHFPGLGSHGGKRGSMTALRDNLIRLVGSEFFLFHNQYRHQHLTHASKKVSIIDDYGASARYRDNGELQTFSLDWVRLNDGVMSREATAMLPIDRELLFRVADDPRLTDALLFILREAQNLPAGKRRFVSWHEIKTIFYPDAPTMAPARVRDRFCAIIEKLRNRHLLGRIPVEKVTGQNKVSSGISIGSIDRIVPKGSDRHRMMSRLNDEASISEDVLPFVRAHNEAERDRKKGRKRR